MSKAMTFRILMHCVLGVIPLDIIAPPKAN